MTTTVAPAGAATTTRGATRNLVLATIGFMVNFWAWALLGPLGPGVKDRLGLSFTAQSLLVAVPVVVGSLGRIPVGALTDRFGARMMFPLVSVATIVPVLTLTVVDSYPALIVTGFFLGIGGTAFAVGVPLVSGWYPPARRGGALGIFGAGTGGTAIANFTTVQLADAFGEDTPFLLVAVILAAYAVVAFLFMRDVPGRTPPASSALGRVADVAKLPVTWQLCFLYAVGFGGFVPPLVMGWVYGVDGSYAIGLMLLSDVALAAAVYTAVRMGGLARRPSAT